MSVNYNDSFHQIQTYVAPTVAPTVAPAVGTTQLSITLIKQNIITFLNYLKDDSPNHIKSDDIQHILKKIVKIVKTDLEQTNNQSYLTKVSTGFIINLDILQESSLLQIDELIRNEKLLFINKKNENVKQC